MRTTKARLETTTFHRDVSTGQGRDPESFGHPGSPVFEKRHTSVKLKEY